ncbi:MAG TPA: MerR family transcriptional regulator [Thermoanaerobaculaceae bacterium]|nr:MerR family transcriptional regulator [Thermoanaerobaculaceae bacterium]
MPGDVVIPDKEEFKIGEVCEIAGVKPFVLRYWETEFPDLAPAKGAGGQRTYTKPDVQLILHIKQLLYEERFTVAGAKKRLAEEAGERTKRDKGERTERAERADKNLDSKPSNQVESLRRALKGARRELEGILALLK